MTVNPLNHPNAQTLDANSSTCKEHGYAAGIYCPDYDTWISGHEALPLADHTGTETRSIDKLPQPEQLGNGGNNGGSFIDTIRDIFQKILDFFKNLFNWMR